MSTNRRSVQERRTTCRAAAVRRSKDCCQAPVSYHTRVVVLLPRWNLFGKLRFCCCTTVSALGLASFDPRRAVDVLALNLRSLLFCSCCCHILEVLPPLLLLLKSLSSQELQDPLELVLCCVTSLPKSSTSRALVHVHRPAAATADSRSQ